LYGGKLPGFQLPTLVIHGARDPRTEPGELDALRQALGRAGRAAGPVARFEILPEGGHSPHSERATADEVTRLARRFLATLAEERRPAAS
jgi:pimeloyl-ACP methyl ester carboxylesterase